LYIRIYNLKTESPESPESPESQEQMSFTMEWFTCKCIVRPPVSKIECTEEGKKDVREATAIADVHNSDEYTTIVSTYSFLPQWLKHRIVSQKAYGRFVGDVLFKSDFS